jgi:chromosome segregation ATPase
MIGEINNIISAKKNLKANISKLIQEITKQMGLLYDVDFQIQLMERKVAWVLGKRTQEETNEINNEIESLEKSKADRQKKLNKLLGSLKNIDEELRNVETRLKTAKEEKKKLTDVIEELELENIKSGQDLQKISKRKEETLVEHDLMKLEIKNLYDKLVSEANYVFKEENKLYQLELSIKEREKEIQVHREILIAEHKAAEEERHRTAMELSQKITRANNLKLKYDSIVQKNKKSGDDDEGVEEHSQAYYVIKTAQEKEELQRLSINNSNSNFFVF